MYVQSASSEVQNVESMFRFDTVYAYPHITMNKHVSSPNSSLFDEYITSRDRKDILNFC